MVSGPTGGAVRCGLLWVRSSPILQVAEQLSWLSWRLRDSPTQSSESDAHNRNIHTSNRQNQRGGSATSSHNVPTSSACSSQSHVLGLGLRTRMFRLPTVASMMRTICQRLLRGWGRSMRIVSQTMQILNSHKRKSSY